MRPFELTAPTTVEAALATPGTFLAGGTTLVDLMKLERPDAAARPGHQRAAAARHRHQRRPADRRAGADERRRRAPRRVPGDLPRPAAERVPAAAQHGQHRREPVAAHPLLVLPRRRHAVQQARARAAAAPRITGANRMHAILGTSDSCVATHASDVAVALVALDARMRLAGADGDPQRRARRLLPAARRHAGGGERPAPRRADHRGASCRGWTGPANSTYVKVRDRQSYEFALCSAAVALDVRDGQRRRRPGRGRRRRRPCRGGCPPSRRPCAARRRPRPRSKPPRPWPPTARSRCPTTGSRCRC